MKMHYFSQTFKQSALYVAAVGLLLGAATSCKDKKKEDSSNPSVALVNEQVTTKGVSDSLYKAAEKKIDSLEKVDSSLHKKVTGDNSEVSSLRATIKSLDGKQNKSKEEESALLLANKKLHMALGASAGLNVVQAVKNIKADSTIKVAFTFNAYDFKIQPVKVRDNGVDRKSTGQQTNAFDITFNISPNRVAATGPYNFYVQVTDPNGAVIQTATGGTTKGHDGQPIQYSGQTTANYVKGTTGSVAYRFQPGGTATKGTYGVNVYENGYLIGTGHVHIN